MMKKAKSKTWAFGREICLNDLEVSVSNEPFKVKFDPNNWILKDVEEMLVDPPLDKGQTPVPPQGNNGVGES